MSATLVTASRTNRSLTSQAPDRAASIAQRKRVMADPVLLIYRRLLDTAVAEASKTRLGLPTDMALNTLAWIKENRIDASAGEVEKLAWACSLTGVCEMLGLDVKQERRRMLDQVKQAYAAAAAKHVQGYVNGRLGLVLTCAGRQALSGQQYVLGLVDVDEYEEIAGIDLPDPPARKARSRHKALKHAA